MLLLLVKELDHERLVIREIGQRNLGHKAPGAVALNAASGTLLLLLQEVERLDVLDVVLQHSHVVGVLLAGHVDAQVAGHRSLVAADVAPKRGLWLGAVGIASGIGTRVTCSRAGGRCVRTQ